MKVLVKDYPPDNVSIETVIKTVQSRVPKKLLSNVKMVCVGKFKELERRKIQGLYKDSTLYITNEQDSNLDMLDDVIHEVAHSVEEIYSDQIYSDNLIEKEFLKKRKKLWSILKEKGIEGDLSLFLNPKFNYEFDNFLHLDVGYDIIYLYTTNLFYSPYGATSLREYFANGFEAFFMKQEISRLKKISPVLFSKLEQLI
ncbi:MAG: hypothetical protein CMC82_00275 [Flavobacteriaceae bacterium]|nr:hypothetical protein [Flavobacteriaceae bacterium]